MFRSALVLDHLQVEQRVFGNDKIKICQSS